MQPLFENRCRLCEKSRMKAIFRFLYWDPAAFQRKALGVVLLFTLGALFSQSVRQFLVSGVLAAVFLVLIGYDTVRPYRKWRRRLKQKAGREEIACLRFLESEVESFFVGAPSENTQRLSYAQINGLHEEPALFLMYVDFGCFPVFKDSFTIGTPEEFPSFLLERMEKAKQEEKETCQVPG